MELPDCFDRAALQKLGRNFLLEGLDDRLHQCGWDRCDDRRACACLGDAFHRQAVHRQACRHRLLNPMGH